MRRCSTGTATRIENGSSSATCRNDPNLTSLAIEKGDEAQSRFKEELAARGDAVLTCVRAEGGFAVVLACRFHPRFPTPRRGLWSIANRCFT